MSLKIRRKRISRSRRKAPRRRESFKKLNEEIGSPFSAVLNTNVLKKPVNKLVTTMKKTLGGKRKKRTHHRKYK